MCTWRGKEHSALDLRDALPSGRWWCKKRHPPWQKEDIRSTTTLPVHSQHLCSEEIPMSDHCAPGTGAGFLFVDYQDDKPQNRSLSRQKAVFAQKAHQRQKRLASVQRLKTSTIPFRQQLPVAYNGVSDTPGTSQEAEESKHDGSVPEPAGPDGKTQYHLLSPQSDLGQGFLDPFATTALPMSRSTNLYFHHCTRASPSAHETTETWLILDRLAFYPS